MARTFTALSTTRFITQPTSRYALKAYSIAFRILPTSTPASDSIPIGNQDTSGGFWVAIGATTLSLTLNNWFATSQAQQGGNTPLNAGVWNHWIGTCTDMTALSPTFGFYLNGAADSNAIFTAGVGAYVAPNIGLTIGNQVGAGAIQGVGGSMESVGIWRRVLTAYEAVALAAGVPPTEFRTGLVSHYELGSYGGAVKDTESGLVALQEGTVGQTASIWNSRPLDYSRHRARSGAAVALPSVRQRQNTTIQAVTRAATF